MRKKGGLEMNTLVYVGNRKLHMCMCKMEMFCDGMFRCCCQKYRMDLFNKQSVSKMSFQS